MLVIGYPVFWLELYGIRKGQGQTTWLAGILFLLISIYVFFQNRASFKLIRKEYASQFQVVSLFSKFLIGLGAILSLAIIIISYKASLLPLHLMQESDALNYHYTLPRQHLILGSFKHIPWAADDLFLLPVQFALAPFWFVTELPNKFPQFLFFLGLMAVLVKLTKYFSQNNLISMILVVFAILGSHHVGIQMGTAMLDLILAYLFFAALDSLLKGKMFLALMEFSFFFWSKSFIPVQMGVIACVMIIIFMVAKRTHFKVLFIDEIIGKYRKQGKKIVLGFLILGIFIGGPFLLKSTYYSGTPFFPLMAGAIRMNQNIDENATHWQSIMNSSDSFVTAATHYGYGRSLPAFVKHFWLIAVPEKGVNNKYDYPLGLVYLLVLGPFVMMIRNQLRRKELEVSSLFIILFWMSWWFGSQQSRYLYIPVFLMVVKVISTMRPSKVFMSILILAMSLNVLSVFRSHKDDFGKKIVQILRPKDLEIMSINRKYIQKNQKGFVDLNFRDVPFAQFPVRAVKEGLPHTLAL